MKYEDIYLRGYDGPRDAAIGLHRYFRFYNCERPHPALAYNTPESVYRQGFQAS